MSWMRVVERPRSVSRQIDENALTPVLVGFALGYVVSLSVHGRSRPAGITDDKAGTKKRLRHRR